VEERHYFRQRQTLAAVGGAYDELEFAPVLAGRICHITRFACEDETDDLTGDLRVYIKGHGYEHWLNEENTVTEDVLYWDVDGTFLTEGESLVARFTGATDGNVLELYIEGYFEEL